MSTPHHRHGWLSAASWVLLAVLVAFIVFCGVWRAQGGRWERVETPSMGTVAPVGTLLWIKPVDARRLRPGDFITFHPPGIRTVTYSHLVHAVHADGTFSTKGVIPAPDPWRLHPSDVVGEVRMRWWGVGWVVTAAPVLLVGGLVVLAVRAMVHDRWRLPATIVLGSLVLTIAISWYRPLVNAQQLAFAADAHGGGATATYVGTGLLPIRLEADHGEHVDLRDGEVGSVHVTQTDDRGRLQIGLSPAIPLWWWVGLVGLCFVPALASLVIGLPPKPDDRPAAVAA